MIRIFLLLFMIFISVEAKTDLLDCDKVFEQRKDELLREMERIDERQQEFEAYQEASKALIEQKEKKLSKKLSELNATLTKVETTKKEIIDLYEENKKVLEEIEKAKDDKISATYLKMKDKKAAAILDNLPRNKAALILFNLTPKKISKIMAKMDPVKASDVTLLLKAGPPFDKNQKIIEEDLEKEKALEARVEEILEENEDEMEFMQVDRRSMFWMVKKKIAKEYDVILSYEERFSNVAHLILDKLWEESLMDYSVTENLMKNVIYTSIENYIQGFEDIEQIVIDKIDGMKRKLIPGTDEYNTVFERYYREELKRKGMF